MDRRGARRDERHYVPRRERVVHLVFFVVENPRLVVLSPAAGAVLMSTSAIIVALNAQLRRRTRL
jgi:hypothetical protein